MRYQFFVFVGLTAVLTGCATNSALLDKTNKFTKVTTSAQETLIHYVAGINQDARRYAFSHAYLHPNDLLGDDEACAQGVDSGIDSISGAEKIPLCIQQPLYNPSQLESFGKLLSVLGGYYKVLASLSEKDGLSGINSSAASLEKKVAGLQKALQKENAISESDFFISKLTVLSNSLIKMSLSKSREEAISIALNDANDPVKEISETLKMAYKSWAIQRTGLVNRAFLDYRNRYDSKVTLKRKRRLKFSEAERLILLEKVSILSKSRRDNLEDKVVAVFDAMETTHTALLVLSQNENEENQATASKAVSAYQKAVVSFQKAAAGSEFPDLAGVK